MNLTNVNPSQTQFDNLNNLISVINRELSDVNDEIIGINNELNLKANSIDVTTSFNSVNQILNNEVDSSELSTTINQLNTATTNALNLEAITFVSMLTIQNTSTQSILTFKQMKHNLLVV